MLEAIDGLNLEDADQEPIQVGDLTLVPSVHTTLRQDAYVMKCAADCGLVEVIEHAREHQDITDVAVSIVQRVWGSGKVPELLAGLLVVEGEKWSAERAAEVADAIGELEDPKAKRQLTDLVSGSTMYFFIKGAASSGLSLSSLSDRNDPAPEQESSTSEAPKSDDEDDPAESGNHPEPSS